MLSQEIHLVRRPRGMPGLSDFALVTNFVPPPHHNEILVRNVYMSVDPYMRGRMRDRPSYLPPFEIGQTLEGDAIGQVVASNVSTFRVGDVVASKMGWREYFVSQADSLRKIEASSIPLTAHLGVLGLPGFTAWFGLNVIGNPEPGNTVFVSAASGAVGSVVGQLAKRRGCKVIGSAGSDQKVSNLKELGFDEAFNYRKIDPREAIRDAAPDGIDVYFDNVGGDHLEAAIQRMRDFGRIVACGMISRYNDTVRVPGPSNLHEIVTKRLLVRGFIIYDHWDRFQEFTSEVCPLVRSGEITWRETVFDGIASAPEALLGLFEGRNLGKMLIRLAPDPAGARLEARR